MTGPRARFLTCWWWRWCVGCRIQSHRCCGRRRHATGEASALRRLACRPVRWLLPWRACSWWRARALGVRVIPCSCVLTAGRAAGSHALRAVLAGRAAVPACAHTYAYYPGSTLKSAFTLSLWRSAVCSDAGCVSTMLQRMVPWRPAGRLQKEKREREREREMRVPAAPRLLLEY